MPAPKYAALCIVCACLAGCEAGSSPTFTAPAPPSKLLFVVQAGDNLEMMAEQAYGHGKYALLVGQHNRIRDEMRLQIGQKVATPPLVEIFESAGLGHELQNAVTALAWAIADYHLALPSYTATRRQLEVRGNFRIDLPLEQSKRFSNIADAVEFAIKDIERGARPKTDIPTRSLAQLRQAAEQVRELAKGAVDGYFYDVDLVDQRLAHGLYNLYVWTIETHR